ncbi:hypothetical protein OOZ15_14230 [Galbibacter sp. EGI 63066]|uniref:hypothetical protein n=1 Tax=Galbibacter sp. EGI 63066 TaxID=2993559 RepID=UPI0022497CE9|nr:hypothetical protein [Galbibacter sp. EGI 63066]MCX2681106.1 hypothetical protein [Galbibacter sp. EGI 63066]
MEKEGKIRSSVKRKLTKLYVVNSKLKETYYECQFYMSHDELKKFYEENFFSINSICDNLYHHLKETNKWGLFFSKIRSICYISVLTLRLYFVKNKFRFLFNRAISLEKKNFGILQGLVVEDEVIQRFDILGSYYEHQGDRMRMIKNTLRSH